MERLRRLLASRAAPFAVATVVGISAALLLVGRGALNPSNVGWIAGDAATYYSAWEQYRHDPHVHFPLPWTERIGYPVGTSLALLDAIPLAAVLLRPVSALLPVPFQYLGGLPRLRTTSSQATRVSLSSFASSIRSRRST